MKKFSSEHKQHNAAIMVVGEPSAQPHTYAAFYTDNIYDESLSSEGISTNFIQMPIDDNKVKAHVSLASDVTQYKSAKVYCPVAYKKNSGFILTFNIADTKTFEQLTKWLLLIRKNYPTAPVLLVGTRVDLKTHETYEPEHEPSYVNEQEAYWFAKKNGLIGYIDASAKLNKHLKKTFTLLCEHLIVQSKENIALNTTTSSLLFIRKNKKSPFPKMPKDVIRLIAKVAQEKERTLEFAWHSRSCAPKSGANKIMKDTFISKFYYSDFVFTRSGGRERDPEYTVKDETLLELRRRVNDPAQFERINPLILDYGKLIKNFSYLFTLALALDPISAQKIIALKNDLQAACREPEAEGFSLRRYKDAVTEISSILCKKNSKVNVFMKDCLFNRGLWWEKLHPTFETLICTLIQEGVISKNYDYKKSMTDFLANTANVEVEDQVVKQVTSKCTIS